MNKYEEKIKTLLEETIGNETVVFAFHSGELSLITYDDESYKMLHMSLGDPFDLYEIQHMDDYDDKAVSRWLSCILRQSTLDFDTEFSNVLNDRGVPLIDLDEYGGEFPLDSIEIDEEISEDADLTDSLCEWWDELDEEYQDRLIEETTHHIEELTEKE